MKRLIFFSLFALVWIVVAGLGAEVYGAFRFKAMELHHNAVRDARSIAEQKHVQAMADAEKAERAAHPVDPAAPPAIAPGFKTQDEALGDVFLAFDETDRTTYVEYKGILVAGFGADGTHTFAYVSGNMERELNIQGKDLPGKKLDAYVPPEAVPGAVELLAKVYGGGVHDKIVFEHNHLRYALALYPVKDAGGAVTAVVGSVERMEQLGAGVPTYDIFEVQWFKFKKNVETPALRTNNLGWRDDDVVLPKPAGTYRIACVGGSCVAEGASTAHTWPNLVEQALQQGASCPVDVVNCGVFAVNTGAEKKRLYDYLELQPDLLITYDGQNEFGTLFGQWKQEKHPCIAFLKKSKFINGPLNRFLLPPRGKMLADMRATSIANLKAMRDVLARKHVAMALCSFARPDTTLCTRAERDFLDWNTRTFWTDSDIMYASYCVLLDRYNAELKAFCEREHVYYVPVAEELRGGLDDFVDICHMTQKGIEAKAEIIARHLKEVINRERSGSGLR